MKLLLQLSLGSILLSRFSYSFPFSCQLSVPLHLAPIKSAVKAKFAHARRAPYHLAVRSHSDVLLVADRLDELEPAAKRPCDDSDWDED